MKKLKKFNENWIDDETEDTNRRMSELDSEEAVDNTIGPHEEVIDNTIGPADYNYNELAMTIQKLQKMSDKVYSKSKKILKKLKRFPAPELENEMDVLIQSLEDAVYMLRGKSSDE